MDPDLRTELVAVTRKLDRMAALIEQRDSLIRRARAEGAPLQEIADVVGLTRMGVKKIVDRHPNG